MKTKLVYLFSLTATMFLTACSNDDDAVVDTVAPVIAINEPHDEDEFEPGGEIHFKALFTDNVALAAYKIEIHEDFDSHTHGMVKSAEQDNPWSYEQVFTIPAGQRSFTADHRLQIPAMIGGKAVSEGAYHMGVFLTDAAGNESQVFLEIHIEEGAEGHDH